jgi:hypothetical protein
VSEPETADQDQRLLAVFEIAKILATEQNLETMLPKFLACLIEALEAADAGSLGFTTLLTVGLQQRGRKVTTSPS